MNSLIAPDVWSGPKLFQYEIDGKKIAFSSETIFTVQVGRGTKGGYTKSYNFKGDIRRAWHFYLSINIGYGFKKRFMMAGKPIAVARS